MLQCWFSFLSHYYNLLQFSLPYFTTFQNVTYSHYFWFLLPTGSTLLFPLFNSPCCSSVCEIIWIANLPSVALAILFLHNIVLNSITQIINENSNWVEYGVDTHLPLQTFSQLTPKHWWILFCEQFLNQLWKLFSWFTCTMRFLGI